MQTKTIWDVLLSVDRRILYLLLFLTISAFLLLPLRLPATITSPARAVYDTIEALQPGDMVMISSNWSASTIAENGPQLEALLTHLMRKQVHFTIMSNEAQARNLSRRIAETVAERNGYVYGQQWAHLGFYTNLVAAIKGMANNLTEAAKQDVKGTPIKDIPVLQNINSLKDYKLVIDVTPSGTMPAWISYRPPNLKVAYFPTSVMAAEGYTYLDSGQLVGMVTGAKGAQEYETMLDIQGLGGPFANAISFSHVLILIFIALGNIALFMSRRAQGGSV